LHKQGVTSATYDVSVNDTRNAQANPLFATRVTFVNVDEAGQKSPISPLP
jgi:hypothetical protein